MSTLSASHVVALWKQAGGAANRAVEFAAIAGAESSLDTRATSSTGARGLWQIEYYNASWAHATADDLYDPLVNARAAIYGSGDGTNCAAWDTCYYDINTSGRYSFLAYPERGSAAWNWIPTITAGLGTGDYTPPVIDILRDPLGKAQDAFATAVYDLQYAVVGFVRDIRITTASIAPIYGPGWR